MARVGKMKVSVEINGAGVSSFTLAFTDGVEKKFTLSPDNELYSDFAAHGVACRFRDKIAGIDDMGEAQKAIDELIAQFAEGTWSTRGGDGEQETYGLLVKAISALSGKPLDEVKASVTGLDKKTQAALRADPAISAKISELRKPAKPKAGVDLSGIMGSLGL